ncbi:GNAT family N-acetyltransferase (plasmid) [Natrinema zhouii]|uniref:GNAT family N-acetyltransferase n=1 Tax=Natrinema zhouii TaxID=1710539 RepID=UPI001CFFF8ED|nr:GNAT family N-acetyltransferase [Natrinema zhouii]UHQ98761.1 GNAT family N-acetyltransferase [Natrinema zhouii]
MEIRRATSEDTGEIRAVAASSWRTDYPNILNREAIEEGVEEWYNSEQIASELAEDDAILLVAEIDDKVVGFTHAVRRQRTGFILRVYVNPDYRKQGIGTELFASARDALLTRGVDDIRAMVLAGNEPGNVFYKTVGFEKVDEEETVIGGETYTENVYVRTK